MWCPQKQCIRALADIGRGSSRSPVFIFGGQEFLIAPTNFRMDILKMSWIHVPNESTYEAVICQFQTYRYMRLRPICPVIIDGFDGQCMLL